MTRPSRPADPTAERTAKMSTQSASGLSGGTPRRASEPGRDPDEDLVRRTPEERDDTPRAYDEDAGS